MGLRELEAAILREARVVSGVARLRQKDIVEWSTGDVKAQAGETVFRLPGIRVSVAVRLPVAGSLSQGAGADS